MTREPEVLRKDEVLLKIGILDREIYALGQTLVVLTGNKAKEAQKEIAEKGTRMMLLTEEWVRITYFQTTGAMSGRISMT